MNKKVAIIVIIVAVVVIGGLAAILLLGVQDPTKTAATLTFWNVYDDSDFFAPLIKEFNQTYKNVKIKYYKKTPTSYEADLIDALAAGQGPDIFAIQNTWLPRHLNKIAPLTDDLMTVKEFQDTFVDVAVKDFITSPPPQDPNDTTVLPSKIYALPLFVDTLALYWNKDIFNSTNIAEPPKDWTEFSADVKKLVKKDESGNIIQAGAAIGTAKNVNRAADILGILMLQTGAKMVNDEKSEATFNKGMSAGGKEYQPGKDSLRFYTDFANPTKDIYTWNDKMDYSIDSFAQGRSAMMINYAYHLATVKAKEPHLRFGIASLPQPQDASVTVNYANYWGLTVSGSANTTNQKMAWIFIKWLTETEQAKKYLESAKRPAARRDLISWQQDDLELGVYARQSLSAKSWYQADNLAVDTIFAEMIDAVANGRQAINEAIGQAAEQVTLLMKE